MGHERPEIRTPPRTTTTHYHHPKPETGEGGSSDPEKPNPDRTYVEQVQAHRPDWTERLILAAISKAEQDGRDPAHCREALLRLARGEHGQTKLPSRLATPGPWWETVAAPAVISIGRQKCTKHPGRFADTCLACKDERPPCPHKVRGGADLHPETGEPRCSMCRHNFRHRASAA